MVLALAAGCALGLPWAWARTSKDASTAMAMAANAFVSSLSAEQREKAVFTFDVPSRMQWHFVPKDRPGLMIKLMSPTQRKLALALLQTGLSRAGYKKTTQIMALEQVLAVVENDPARRDPEKYYFSVFGRPEANATWGWKVEGHHLSLNFTVVDGSVVASTPAFLGANPGEVRQGPYKGMRVLAREEDEGRKLLLSLNSAQRQRAIFDKTAPPDIVTGSSSKAGILDPVGLPAADMNAAQVRSLMALVNLYAATMAPAVATARLARVQALGTDQLSFGWAGEITRGAPHYYRISAPGFVVEYDNTQNDANHVHTVWRDYDNDFGRDLLGQHLREDHK